MMRDPKMELMLSDLEAMMPAQVMPALDQAAASAGKEAPTIQQQRKRVAAPMDLRAIYEAGRDESAEKNPEGDRKPFKWSDLDGAQKKDLVLRLGLGLMQHAPSGIGLSGFGKAGAEALGHMDQMQEKNREDARGRRKEGREEGMSLASLANMEQDAAQRNRQLDQADRQVLPGAEGYALADLAAGTAQPLLDSAGEPVLPASTGRDSVFQQRYKLGLEIAREQGLEGTAAKKAASDYAASNRTHVDPNTYIRARAQVMDTLLPNGRPSRELRAMMEATGKSAQDIVDEQTDQLLSRYKEGYAQGGSLSEMSQPQPQPQQNPFIQQ